MAEATEVAGGVWMPLEDYAALFKFSNPEERLALLRRFKDMVRPNSKRTKEIFAPQHVKRISMFKIFVYVTKPGVGEAAPRIIKRPSK